MRNGSLVVVVGAVLVATGCGTTVPGSPCAQGGTRACFGADACAGAQACLPDGGFGSCSCAVWGSGGGAGAGGGATVDGGGGAGGGDGHGVSAAKSELSAPSSVRSGSEVTITLQARDDAGNPLTTGGAMVAFLASPAGGTASLGPVTDHADGTYTSQLTGRLAGRVGVSATIDGVEVTATLSVLVTPGPASTLTSLVRTPSSLLSGTTVQVSVEARDAANNSIATGGEGITLELGAGTGTARLGATADLGDGTYAAPLTGALAGSVTVTATLGGLALLSTGVVLITPGAASVATSSLVGPAMVATRSSVTVSLTVRDAAGNQRGTGGDAVVLALAGAPGLAALGATVDDGDGTYHATLTGLLPGGPVEVTATLGGRPVLPSAAVRVFGFMSSADMTIERSQPMATRLRDGRVLLTNGFGPPGWYLASAELFDPTGNGGMGSFSATGNTAYERGTWTSATLLPDGRVLIAGGSDLVQAELFDPAGNGGAGSFRLTASMSTPRDGLTATVLPSGKVLLAGGSASPGSAPLASAELFDPAGNDGGGSFTPTGSMGSPRFLAAAVLLPGGKVLVAGGVANSGQVTAELYDPAGADGGGSFSPTGNLSFPRNRFSGVVLLPSGKVLFAGGAAASGRLASAELYEPAGNGGAGAFTLTGSMAIARDGPMAALLPDGRVLFAGGNIADFVNEASAELFDPSGNGGIGSFSPAGSMAYRRAGGTATPLLDGRVLIAGGNGSMGDTHYQRAELFVP